MYFLKKMPDFEKQTIPPEVLLPVRASAFSRNTCSLNPSDSAFQTESCDCWTVCKRIANGTNRSFMKWLTKLVVNLLKTTQKHQ